MLEQGLLVSPEYSAEMKSILSNPGVHHKFVKGLEGVKCEIYRKSGTWTKYHADAALIMHGAKKYIAVALMEHERGAEIFPKLIQKMDRAITID
jgi:beta-lactamase class A